MLQRYPASFPAPLGATPASAPERPWHSPVWWVTFAGVAAMLFSVRYGAALIALFLATWLAYAAARPLHSLDAMFSTRLPWAIPLLCVTSALWSALPFESARVGLQLCVVTAFALLAARRQSPRDFVSAYMLASLLGTLGSLASGNMAVVGPGGEVAMTGIFNSKNNAALNVCLTFFATLAVAGDRRQPAALRLISLLGLMVAPYLLVKTRSVGAVITCFAGLGTLGLVLALSWLRSRERSIVGLALAVMGAGTVACAALILATIDLDVLLKMVGKDASLTGRTYLWQRAGELMEQRPALGIGYNAFWVRETPDAEGLWRYGSIKARGGFHFHNLFYEVGVQLGWIGIAVVGTSILAAAAAVALWCARAPSGANAFFAAVTVFFLIRTMAEIDYIGPYSVGSFLLPVTWIYATSRSGEAASRPIPRRPRPTAARRGPLFVDGRLASSRLPAPPA